MIFPPLVPVKAKMTQRVRVGTTARVDAIEKSYRILVEELPTGDVAPVANQVAVRTRIGIPVFIEPTRPGRSGGIDAIAIKDRTVTVTLKNTGDPRDDRQCDDPRDGGAGPDGVRGDDSGMVCARR